MQITAKQAKEIAKHCGRIIETRPKPALKCVRIAGSTAMATNLRETVRVALDNVSADKPFLVPLSTLKTQIKIVGKDGTIDLRDLASGEYGEDDFPDELAPQVPHDTVPGEPVLSAIRGLMPFAAADATRYMLHGVHIDDVDENEPRLVATDGRTLAYMATDLRAPHAAQQQSNLIEPSRWLKAKGGKKDNASARAYTRVADNDCAVLGITMHGGRIAYEQRISMAGAYPVYRQVVTDATHDRERTTVEVPAGLAKRVGAFPSNTSASREEPTHLTVRDGVLTLQSEQHPEYKLEVPCDDASAELHLVLCAAFLERLLDAGYTTWHLPHKSKVALAAEIPNIEGATALVMPIC